jgi:hypothetical protein
MDFEPLADRPEAVPTIARWHFHEWSPEMGILSSSPIMGTFYFIDIE